MPIASTVPLIVGYACVWDTLSVVMKDKRGNIFREKFAPHAFGRALSAGADVRALVNHDPSLVLGRLGRGGKAGTLTLREDETGLLAEITPPTNSLGKTYTDMVRRGDLSGMSFRFYPIRDSWSTSPDGTPIRTVTSAELDDVSIVAYPAYLETTAFVEDPPLQQRPAATPAATPAPTSSRARPAVWDPGRYARLRLAEAGFATCPPPRRAAPRPVAPRPVIVRPAPIADDRWQRLATSL